MKYTKIIIILLVITTVILAILGVSKNTHSPQQIVMLESYETITLAGGCFWCIESAFQEQPGVIDAVSGYSGGLAETANYPIVASGQSKHREVVQIIYDTNIISFDEILNNYWSAIDPRDAGGQFADRGYQYTTAIYYHTDSQKKVAQNSKMRLEDSGLLDQSIVTEILTYENFYPAEEYHQDYYKKSSEHYKFYETASGRKGFTEETWARDAALEFFNTGGESIAS